MTVFGWKSRFYLMSRNVYVGYDNPVECWKSRFYLMSRNREDKLQPLVLMLEKPVLFDVTELQKSASPSGSFQTLEKPVLFDVTERSSRSLISVSISCWKSRFYLMSRNNASSTSISFSRLEKPVLFDVTEQVLVLHFSIPKNYVGKAGFI